MTKPLFLAVALLVAGCRSDAASETPDGGATVDAPDGTGCTPMTPRTQPVESFIGPTGLQTRITTLIDSAKTSLDVQMYLFTVSSFAQKIVDAKNRGVAVRVILDPDEPNNTAISAFTSGGVAWKNASTIYTFSHAKYMVIDKATAVVMSMNFNGDALSNERNYGFVDRDLEDVADLQAVFDQDWALANGQAATAANLACTRLIVSPVNAQQRILSFINSATKTLDVEVLYITDATVRNAIGAAKARGVNIRVILESAQDQMSNADTSTYFGNLGIPVHFVTTQFYLHAKLIIADGVAFVGSENMSPTSLTKNREVGALVFEPSAMPTIQAQFDADWTATGA